MKLLCSAAAGVLSMLAFTLSREGYAGVSDPPLAAFSLIWILYALLLGGLWYLFFSSSITPRFLCRLRDGAGITYKRVSSTHATLGFVKPSLSEQAETANTDKKHLWLGVSKGQVALGLCFGVVNYFAAALFAYDTWSFLNSFWQWGKALLQILGQAAVMTTAAALVCRFLESSTGRERRLIQVLRTRIGTSWAVRAYQRRPVLFVMGVLLVCWSPYLVIFYPGTVVWDMAEMAAMQFGLREITTWHPVFMTWLFAGCIRLGRIFGSDNLGVFCFTLMQSALLAYALACALELLRKLRVSRVFRLLALLFFALTPIFPSFAQAVGKDTVYTALVLLFTVQTIEWLRFGKPKTAAVAAYGITALLLCLTRHNGVYLLLPTAVVLVIALRGKARGAAATVLGAVLAVFFVLGSLLVPALGIRDATASGMYSAAFQQSARTLRDHEVTAEEYAQIDAILDAENVAALYEPNISDPVKYTFKQYGLGRDVEQEALTRYRKAWLSMFIKYPLTYLEAFIAGSTGYYAFTPKIDAARTFNNQGGIRFVFETVPAGEDPLDLHTTQIAAFQTARELLAMVSRGWRRVPVLELFLFCASYTWLLIIAALSLVRQKRGRMLIAFLPALLSLLVCLFSPVNDYFRYFLPIVAMTAPLLALAKNTGQTV